MLYTTHEFAYAHLQRGWDVTSPDWPLTRCCVQSRIDEYLAGESV